MIRKASRLSQGSWGEAPKFLAHVAFRETKTGLFLTVQGDELRLVEPHLTKMCQFAAHAHQTSISGFKSVVTRQWLGQTFMGDLKVGETWCSQCDVLRGLGC